MHKKIILLITVIALLTTACRQRTGNTNNDSAKATGQSISPPADATVDPDPYDSVPASKYGIHSSGLQTANLVRLTLQRLYETDIDKNLIDSNSRRFIFFEYDLNDDSKNEIFVGLTGPYFCGTGGCTQYLLDNQGNVITKFTVSGYPVIIDNNKTNGWKDLFVESGGKNRILKFNGLIYPANPSNQPELKTQPGDGLTRALDFKNEPYPRFKF